MTGLRGLDLLGLAVGALGRDRLRTGLTGLGVFLGVAATSATLQVQHITTQNIQAQLNQREAPQVQASVWRYGQIADLEAIAEGLPGVAAVSGITSLGWSERAIYQAKQVDVRGSAVTVDYFATTGRRLVQGQPLSRRDFAQYHKVAVIDQVLATQLFNEASPLGKVFYLRGLPWRVVGVMETKFEGNPEGGQPQGQFVIPLSTQIALTGRPQVDQIIVRPVDVADLEPLRDQVKALLRQRHPGYTQGFFAQLDLPRVTINIADIQESQETLRSATRSLLAVGAIALTIAGVGIANIAVASTFERRKEIGLRRAIGATAQDVLSQFILESLLISIVGGIVAIALVEGITFGLITYGPFELPPYQLNWGNSAVAIAAAMAVGISASLIPAWQASQLDPVKALRS
ncbi:MAG: ABC transporter permease [Spirulina sp. DLM2.Bin59]|nr:MAG: ABC transporter permease [Spirulina sp. DLM2.Bin59]